MPSLFNLPASRNNKEADKLVVNKSTNKKSASVVVRGGGLIEKIATINALVNSKLGKYKDDYENAKNYAKLADKYATAETNLLWNPRKNKIGVVKERINWLDKLVGKK